jgi:hypothetical protein
MEVTDPAYDDDPAGLTDAETPEEREEQRQLDEAPPVEYEPTPAERRAAARSAKATSHRLLLETIALTGLADRQFAKIELGINERTLRRYKGGKSDIPAPILALLRARNRELVRIQIRRDRQGVPRDEQLKQLREAYRTRGLKL